MGHGHVCPTACFGQALQTEIFFFLFTYLKSGKEKKEYATKTICIPQSLKYLLTWPFTESFPIPKRKSNVCISRDINKIVPNCTISGRHPETI